MIHFNANLDSATEIAPYKKRGGNKTYGMRQQMHMLWQMHTAQSAISVLLPRQLLIRVTAEEVVSKLRFGGREKDEKGWSRVGPKKRLQSLEYCINRHVKHSHTRTPAHTDSDMICAIKTSKSFRFAHPKSCQKLRIRNAKLLIRHAALSVCAQRDFLQERRQVGCKCLQLTDNSHSRRRGGHVNEHPSLGLNFDNL